MPATAPVIVIPGISATYLRDQYPLPPETIWTVMHKDFERAGLHPDAPQFEARQPARVVPDQMFEIAYKELIEELRHNLTSTASDPVPVYPFAYDWRQPFEVVEDQLLAFSKEVVARTRLQRNYNAAGYGADGKVNLVGHSMGGLIVAGLLARRGAEAPVAKVVSLGSPFQGSFEAAIKVATGTGNFGGETPSSREREAARMTPALYYLMPGEGIGVAPDAGLPPPGIR
jgi:Lecithin:cholesterol acyltransferase